MKKFCNLIIMMMISLSLIVSPAFAGDVMPKGTVLQEDSYVFTIEDAKELMLRIESLELDLKDKDELILELKRLDLNQQSQIIGLESIIELKDLQILEYKEMHDLDTGRILKLDRQIKNAKWERWGFFGLGVGLSIGSILIADKIDDSIEGYQYIPPDQTSSARMAPLFKF